MTRTSRDHRTTGRRTRSLLGTLGVASGAAILTGGIALAATNWVLGLNATSHGQAKSATLQNISISAVSSPTATNLLYPHGSGDVVARITNPNFFPVTITGVKLPKTTVFAPGYSTKTLTSAKLTCTAAKTKSDVSWHYASTTTGSTHTLKTPLVVAGSGTAAKDPLTVVFTNDAYMGTTAAAACEGVYFKMPSLQGVTAYGGGAATPSSQTAVDSWTS